MEDLSHIVTHKKPDRPYLTFLAAQAEGIVNADDLTSHALNEPLSAKLDRGLIPVEDAGLIQLGQDEWAVDHVAVIYSNRNELILGPTCKNDVGPEGELYERGAILLTQLSSGLIKVVAEAIADNRSRWINPRLEIGRAAVRHIWPAQTYEPKNIDEGIIQTRLWTP